ncbi:MAG: hypothetical protein UV05_C0020G0003 [candidate division CPR1 bacterium GW2011_GWA2_42_17]|uniref:DUF11 domain-containing protein n=1 Tax=candidate division CPR1 bacterium GW2011_GWA2_42_17 TaxID=1618341 RepID=A0A0G0Z508_9BACT|nr:MAG: hypothetical protein UV05_C0020G0003 [candidate division CPR1 bacterium GW2011_GWA2_42_17]
MRKSKLTKKHNAEIEREVEQLEMENSTALADLYNNEDNHHDKKNIEADINNFRPKVKTWWQRVQTASSILIIILMVSAATGWFFFQKNRAPFSGQGLALTWQTSENIASGELTTIILEAENKEQIDLQKITMDITLPNNFVVSKTSPELVEGSALRWRVDSLSGGEKVSAAIEGAYTGPENKMSLRAYASYNPAGLTSNFSVSAEKEVPILVSDYEVVLSPAVTFKIGEKQVLTLDIISKNDMTSPVIQVLLPEAVGLDNVAPAKDKDVPEDRLLQWTMPEFKANKKQSFKFSVTPSAQTPANSKVAIIIGLKQNQTMKVLSTIIKPFGLNSSAVDVKLVLKNETKFLDWGADAPMQVVLKSLAQGVFKDAKLTVNLAGPVRWGGIKGEVKPQDGFGQNMVWTEKEFSDLKNVGASAIILPFIVPLENSSTTESALSGKVIFAGTLTTDTDKGGYPVSVEYIFGSVPMKGAVTLNSTAQYFDENMQPVGSGPLPPVVGKGTTYSIVWRIASPNQNLVNVIIKANLPSAVIFNSSLTPNVNYDATARTISWQASNLSKSATASRIEFSITLNPQAVDAGKVVGLLGKTSVTATDEQGQIINQIADGVTTADAVNGKGVVQLQ